MNEMMTLRLRLPRYRAYYQHYIPYLLCLNQSDSTDAEVSILLLMTLNFCF
jgi:hypothetical protein